MPDSGVTPSQLTAFGDALLQTWEQHFGPAFTPELRQAWTTLYATVQRDMVQTMKVTKPVENFGRQ